MLSAYGVETHTLPLVVAGYGVLGGVGWGLGYISPVSTMMRWFPDRFGWGCFFFFCWCCCCYPSLSLLYSYSHSNNNSSPPPFPSPFRRGLATGLALTAFGGGALIATPAAHLLYDHFFELPMYLGDAADVTMETIEGWWGRGERRGYLGDTGELF